MNERFQAIVSGAIFALIIGWVLHIGKDVLVPIAFGIMVVYLIVGLTRLLCRVPILGRLLPVQIRNGVSVLVISSGLVGVLHLLIANTDDVMAHAPQYQRSLLAVPAVSGKPVPRRRLQVE